MRVLLCAATQPGKVVEKATCAGGNGQEQLLDLLVRRAVAQEPRQLTVQQLSGIPRDELLVVSLLDCVPNTCHSR